MRWLLKPAELAYRGVARLRRALYRTGLRRPLRLSRPVISIGNIAFGGSGKTPLVIAVAEELSRRGYRLAVLTRGYGRGGGEQFALVTEPDAARFGDEPVLISRSVPDVPVIVGADRHGAALWFLQRGDCDAFLLDDGFQHLRLHRDLDVVIDDRGAPLLREGRTALSDADVLVHRNDSAGVGGFTLSVQAVSLVMEGQERPLDSFRQRRTFAFSGLANNEQFFESCRLAGLHLAGTRGFRDHHHYTREDLLGLRGAAQERGAELLVTTEKDAVKIGDSRIAFLRVRAVVSPRDAFFDRLSEVIQRRERA